MAPCSIASSGTEAGGPQLQLVQILSDIRDVVNGMKMPSFGSLTPILLVDPSETVASRYIRVQLVDKAGLIDEIQAVIGANIITNHSHREVGTEKIFACLTQPINDNQAEDRVQRLNESDAVIKEPLCLRIETKAGE